MRTATRIMIGLLLTGAGAQAQERFLTEAEASGYRRTPRYQETIDYLRRLEAASRKVRLEQFGTTPEGRPMYCAIVSSERAFTPPSVRHQRKLVVLIQNGIHAGEIDGKDACLALIRDAAVTGTQAGLLQRLVLVIIPVYNIDGHEMMSPYNRINQNGPEEMGFRATAHNYNLNRDYLKADAPETRALIRLWNRWQPDFFIDNHVTDGADFQYAVTYTITRHGNADAAIQAWGRQIFEPTVKSRMAELGEPIFPYVITRGKPVDSGVIDWVESPRYSTGYAAIRNRPGLLVEMHMLKDYRRRVTANYKMMVVVLELLNDRAESLRQAVTRADSLAAAGLTGPVPVDFTRSERADTVRFLGYRHEVRRSGIAQETWVAYDTTRPVELRVPYFQEMEVKTAVSVPYAYLIPPQWTAVAEILALHDIRLRRLREPATLTVGGYRFDSVAWARESFEGHHLVSYRSRTQERTVTYPAGTVVALTAQPGVRLLVHALEPDAPDAFVRWGYFDTILEQKEYAEAYAAEALAQRMLASDPSLKREFEERLKTDSAFAGSGRARWDFFYKRSPYAEPTLNVYPIGRLEKSTALPLTDY